MKRHELKQIYRHYTDMSITDLEREGYAHFSIKILREFSANVTK